MLESVTSPPNVAWAAELNDEVGWLVSCASENAHVRLH